MPGLRPSQGVTPAMKAVRAGLVAPRKFELIEVDLAPGPGEVVVEIAACGICSSEIPRYDGSWLKEVPAFMGHEASGVVAEVGPGDSEFKPGDRVTGVIRSGFATHGLAGQTELVRIPDHVALEHALGEPLMCVSNVARSAAPQFGDVVALVGCGAMGLLTLAALRSPSLGALIAVDTIASRLAIAEECGATLTIDAAKLDATAEVLAFSGGGADVVVEFTGGPGGLELATSLLRRGQGKLIMAGYHHTPATYDLRGFAAKGLIAHSPHPNYSPDMMADYRRGMAALARGVFPMHRIVTNSYPLALVGDGFEALISHEEGYIKGIVVPQAR